MKRRRSDRGLVDVLKLDETATRADPRMRAAADRPPGPGVALGLWWLRPPTIRRLRAAGYWVVGTLDDDYWHIPEGSSHSALVEVRQAHPTPIDTGPAAGA